jgi:DNA (cytosine-5)-methyltransferase 1
MMMRYFSMFSGIGGFELGIGKGHDCVGYSEINKYAIQCYKSHFGGHKNYGDATTIDARGLPDFDLLCGGFPCQAFSIAGRRKGFDDTRGTLFFEIARIAKIKRPAYLLLENVKGLLNHDKGQTFRVIVQALDELGYNISWLVLNSKNFGVPQNRERVYIIGCLRGGSARKVFPIGEHNKETDGTVSYALDANYQKGNNNVDKCRRTLIHCVPCLTPDRLEKRQNGRRFKDDGEPSFTLTGRDIHGVCLGESRIRRLTPTECERLQGFPDGWTSMLSDTQRYKCLGNAVTVNVIEWIMRHTFVRHN